MLSVVITHNEIIGNVQKVEIITVTLVNVQEHEWFRRYCECIPINTQLQEWGKCIVNLITYVLKVYMRMYIW